MVEALWRVLISAQRASRDTYTLDRMRHYALAIERDDAGTELALQSQGCAEGRETASELQWWGPIRGGLLIWVEFVAISDIMARW